MFFAQGWGRLAIALLAGCIGLAASTQSFTTRGTVSAADGDAAESATSSPLSALKSFATPTGVTTPQELPKKKFGTGLGSGFKAAASKVGRALTLKPKVIGPDDPTLLASRGAKIGAEVYLAAAMFSESQGQLDQAEKNYRLVLKTTPRHHGALLRLGRLYERSGRSKEALAVYQQAVRLYPQDAVAWNDLAQSQISMRQNPQAIASLQKAIQLNPGSVLYRNNLAKVLVRMKRGPEALAQLQQVLDPAIAQYNLAYLFHEADQDDAANHHLIKSLQLDPTLAEAQLLLQKIRGAQISAAPAADADRLAGRPQRAWTTHLPTRAPAIDTVTDEVPSRTADESSNMERTPNPQDEIRRISYAELSDGDVTLVPPLPPLLLGYDAGIETDRPSRSSLAQPQAAEPSPSDIDSADQATSEPSAEPTNVPTKLQIPQLQRIRGGESTLTPPLPGTDADDTHRQCRPLSPRAGRG